MLTQKFNSSKSIRTSTVRPAGVLSQTAMKFKSDVIIESGETENRC